MKLIVLDVYKSAPQMHSRKRIAFTLSEIASGQSNQARETSSMLFFGYVEKGLVLQIRGWIQ